MHSMHLADQTLAEALPAGIVVLNEHGQMLWWNSAAKRFLGLSTPFHVHQTLAQIIGYPNFEPGSLSAERKVLEINAPASPYQRLALSTGVYHEDQYLVMIENVTQRYRLEQMRQDFIANVSHELRTPLTVIRGYLEMILEMRDNPPENMPHMIEQMFDQSLRMEKLVEDLLLLSRLETDLPETNEQKRVNLHHLLSMICNEARVLSGERQHEITLEGNETCYLFAQEDELRSAFSNIIFNAVNYTLAKGKIHVHLYCDKQGVHLKVTDTGIGIAKAHIPRLTERFYRVDKARSRANGGTGLGLAIVKHVLLRHDGSLEITSKPGKGSIFHCIFSSERLCA